MHRALLPVLAPLLLAACAPAPASRAPASTSSPSLPPAAAANLRAAFGPEGVAWVDAGQACVARAPSYRPVCPRLPGAAVDAAWNGGDAWAALPGVGLLVTLDRAARSVLVGRVVALSGTRAYREDGSAVTYDGSVTTGVPGAPSAAVTGGNGQDYVLLAGTLRRVSDGTLVERAAGPLLEVTPTGARSTNVPSVTTPAGTYRLTGTALQRLDASGRVLAGVTHGPGRVGMVGTDLVTVSPGRQIRVFGSNLQAVNR